MGLAEKRIAAALESDSFPTWKKDVLSKCTDWKVEFEVNWADLVKEGFSEHYPKAVEFNFFGPLKAAVANICIDDMGKSALKDKIKLVKITCQRGWSSLEVKVDGSTLHLDADPSYARTQEDCSSYTGIIQKALEDAL